MSVEEMHQQILQRLTKIETNSDNTLIQTTKTNGRVSNLEGKVLKITLAMVFVAGVLIGLGIIDWHFASLLITG